jgi:hypothetical protein
MTTGQLIFSLGVGLAVLASGAALALGGLADWGLFWAGAAVSGLALFTHLKDRKESPALAQDNAFATPERVNG